MTKLYFESDEAKQIKTECIELLLKAHGKLELYCKGVAKDHNNDSQYHLRIVTIAKCMDNIISASHEVPFT
jgi:hypothetical protein